jgi:hypothetical protein
MAFVAMPQAPIEGMCESNKGCYVVHLVRGTKTSSSLQELGPVAGPMETVLRDSCA